MFPFFLDCRPLRKATALVLFLLLAAGHVQGADPLWLRYPAISPDGSTIVFSWEGDLWLVHASGGTARPLTVNDAHDFRPVWSHDGKTIAFASDRYGSYDIFVMPAEGGPARRLTFHSAHDYPTDFTPDDRSVIFSSSRLDAQNAVLFPSRLLSELYQVSLQGDRPRQLLTTPALLARFDHTGNRLLYHDIKGYEDPWRKHHQSSVARDLWLYDFTTNQHRKITSFPGEDRNPIWDQSEEGCYYLSERDGDFNIWHLDLDHPDHPRQLTHFRRHPVRFLTRDRRGTLCFGWNGEIYLLDKDRSTPRKVSVSINLDDRYTGAGYRDPGGEISEMAVSPTGKEVAFIKRGEVFVTSVDHKTTIRITDTPEQERSVSFSPDGRHLVYAGERNGSWNLYQASLVRKEDKLFHLAAEIVEEPLLATEAEEFQPRYSPDGKEVAFLEERTTLKVLTLKTGRTRVILPGEYNYSYADGDQWYDWSPDGKWFLVNFLDRHRWSNEVGLLPADGQGELLNLTRNGYEDEHPRWMGDGEIMIWQTNRNGLRSHGGWGSEYDTYALFFTRKAWDRFRLTPAEYDLIKDQPDKDEDESTEKEKDEHKHQKKPNPWKFEPRELPDPVKIDFHNLEDRIKRLTPGSCRLSDAFLSRDGEKLYYLARFEKKYDLWQYEHRTGELKRLTRLDADWAGYLQQAQDDDKLFLLTNQGMVAVNLHSGKRTNIEYDSRMYLRPAAERNYLFEHVWRQMLKKFYDPQMNGVDWKFYKKEYARFLPYINNNADFAEMLSEMLGELNASHTGSGYRHHRRGGDATASLGAFFDPRWEGDGLRVLELLEDSPLLRVDPPVKPGTIIEKIAGHPLPPGFNYFPLLNHQAGKHLLLSFRSPHGLKHWQATVKPISLSRERELLYRRWVRSREALVDSLSGGRLGYAHVRSMSDHSFREIFGEILGRHSGKEALVVDTRFNGGGNLTGELTAFLSGRWYSRNAPRGQVIGDEPWDRWNKPSVVVMSESNYSDAHYFPWAYRELGIGKLVGMPVPGTATAVWWETLQDPSLYFGIPQVGIEDKNGNYLENQQLEPDILVNNDPASAAAGRDRQLEKAVEFLLKELEKNEAQDGAGH